MCSCTGWLWFPPLFAMRGEGGGKFVSARVMSPYYAFVRGTTISSTCWVASHVDEFIGPVALLDPVIVSQSRFAGKSVRRSVFALNVVGAASGTVREQTELVFASGRTDRRNCGRWYYKHVIVVRNFSLEKLVTIVVSVCLGELTRVSIAITLT